MRTIRVKKVLPGREAFFLEEGLLDMVTYEDDIRLLIQIVKKDLDIQEKRRFLEEVPTCIKNIRKEVGEMDDELGEAKKEFEKFESERRHLEREVKTQNDKINSKRLDRDKANSNKVFRALGHEIEYLTKMVDKEEERILTILEKTEGKKKKLEERTVNVDQRKNEFLEEVKKLENDMLNAEETLKALEDEKVRILPHLSQKVRRMYDRISKVKGDSGVANLIGDVCRGCFSRVPPQKAHEIRKNDQILTCEVCGRILVHFESD